MTVVSVGILSQGKFNTVLTVGRYLGSGM